eukprot:scaffold293641_cov30-Tisochrysis_lutea.AAC.3
MDHLRRCGLQTRVRGHSADIHRVRQRLRHARMGVEETAIRGTEHCRGHHPGEAICGARMRQTKGMLSR